MEREQHRENNTRLCSFLFCLLVLSACNEQPTQSGDSGGFLGTWVLKTYEDDVTVMERSFGLDSCKYGFRILSGGDFLERKNAGWCGTPPIAYANFSGEWRSESDSLVQINVGYWGGRLSYRLQVVSLSESELKVRFIYPTR